MTSSKRERHGPGREQRSRRREKGMWQLFYPLLLRRAQLTINFGLCLRIKSQDFAGDAGHISGELIDLRVRRTGLLGRDEIFGSLFQLLYQRLTSCLLVVEDYFGLLLLVCRQSKHACQGGKVIWSSRRER